MLIFSIFCFCVISFSIGNIIGYAKGLFSGNKIDDKISKQLQQDSITQGYTAGFNRALELVEEYQIKTKMPIAKVTTDDKSGVRYIKDYL